MLDEKGCLNSVNADKYTLLNKLSKMPFNIVKKHVFYDYSFKPMGRFIKNRCNGQKLVGCEIGVLNGDHSFCLLKNLNISKLYLIDPYIPYGMYKNPNDNMKIMLDKLKGFDNFEFIRKLSCDAVGDVPDDLDFVYIDGNHEYKVVRQDIYDYWDKIKLGGVMGGHDYSPSFFGVIQAVNEFKNKFDLKLFGQDRDWWFLKC